MKITRQVNVKTLKELLGTVQKARVAVGWTGPLAQIAYIQEYGANLKGGQPYMVDGEGYMTFLKKTSKLGKKALKAGYSHRGGNVKVRRNNLLPDEYSISGLGVTKPTRIPARFLLLHTKENHRKEWEDFATEMGKRVSKGKSEWEPAMKSLGIRIKKDILKELRAGQPPKNTTLTAMRKGFNHPLQGNKNRLDLQIRVITEVGK